MTNLLSVPRAASIVTLCVTMLFATVTQAQTRYTFSADGQEVLDTTTNLLWRRCAEGMQWDGAACKGKAKAFKLPDARRAVDATSKATEKPWRVPYKDELQGILFKSKKGARIDAVAFPNTPATLFWALRPGSDDNLNAWLINFASGHAYGNVGQGKASLRLVRTNL